MTQKNKTARAAALLGVGIEGSMSRSLSLGSDDPRHRMAADRELDFAKRFSDEDFGLSSDGAVILKALNFLKSIDTPNTYQGDALKLVRVNAAEKALEFIAASGVGDMLKATYDPAAIAEQLVGLVASQTLTNKTLTAPTIGSFTNATHDHTNAVGGGLLNVASVFNVKVYGAVGDGSTDDTTAIQDAIDAVPTTPEGGVVFFPAGSYKVTTLALNKAGLKLVGQGFPNTRIITSSATLDVLVVTKNHVQIRELELRPLTNNRTAGSMILATSVFHLSVRRCRISSPWNAITLTGVQQSEFVDLKFTDLTAVNAGWNRGIFMQTCITCDIVRLIASTSAADVGAGMVDIDSGCDSIRIDGANLSRTSTGSQLGIRLQHSLSPSSFAPRWIRISDVYIEGGNNPLSSVAPRNGITIDDALDVRISNFYIQGSDIGLRINGGTYIHVENGIISKNERHGVLIAGGTDVHLSGLNIDGNSWGTTNTHDGINVSANVSNFSIIDCQIRGELGTTNHRHGITIVAGTSTDFTVRDNFIDGYDTAAFVNNATGNIQRVQHARGSDEGLFNVQDFGATGDGSTDDTAAIQAALDAAKTANGGIVFFPKGSYLCASALAMNNAVGSQYDGIIVEGVGSDIANSGSEILFSGATGPLFTIYDSGGGGNGADRPNHILFRDITLRASSGSLSGSLLRLRAGSAVVFDRVHFQAALSGTLVDGNGWVSVAFHGCRFKNAAVGVEIVAIATYTNFANQVKFEDCLFDDLTKATDFSVAGREVLFDHCVWEPAPDGSASPNVIGTFDTKFRDCQFVDADGTGTWIDATAGTSILVDGCFINSAALCMNIDVLVQATVTNNILSGATTAVRFSGTGTRNTTVSNNRIIIVATNGIGIDIQAGLSHYLQGNSIVETGGGVTDSVGYQLSSGTGGYLRDTRKWNIDTFISDSSGVTGAWTIESGSGGVDTRVGSPTNTDWHAGSGAPESSVTALVGSLYLQTDGSTGAVVYLKDSGTGNTGWRALVDLSASQTLTNKTLTTPAIGSFASATHDHEDSAGGATLGHNAATDNPTVAHGATGAVVGTTNTQTLTNKTLSATSTLLGAAEIQSGTGTPEAAVTSPVGSLFLRTDGGAGTVLYVKESGTGSTGWAAK